MRDDDMVGLSIILETQKGFINHNNKKTPQVINKATMINKNKQSSSSSTSTSKRVSQSSPFPVPTFLEHCFLCRQKLLQGKDIYMYKLAPQNQNPKVTGLFVAWSAGAGRYLSTRKRVQVKTTVHWRP
ncbi:FCS-Like Zinc finger 15-like isoform X2 [Tripterygium wilfordii]|uniref:FCS-Like Zinc finger 15-like isoform X2 n=1 Tax=Tripterygium wilfordii TaxID=458696 RepID=UPI0018F851C5|nr:FCS-Like Zinc finger 15-like isoform X2 [Tripterygium wilfordii]